MERNDSCQLSRVELSSFIYEWINKNFKLLQIILTDKNYFIVHLPPIRLITRDSLKTFTIYIFKIKSSQANPTQEFMITYLKVKIPELIPSRD